jgi:hypothetical protein
MNFADFVCHSLKFGQFLTLWWEVAEHGDLGQHITAVMNQMIAEGFSRSWEPTSSFPYSKEGKKNFLSNLE